ncbi:hypothetical protein [Microcoleus sp. CAWBG58]|nr:hypothetical protein [Microcoleus sp. CAWBG58]
MITPILELPGRGGCQLSTVNCQLSTVNCQLSTVNCQLNEQRFLAYLYY